MAFYFCYFVVEFSADLADFRLIFRTLDPPA